MAETTTTKTTTTKTAADATAADQPQAQAERAAFSFKKEERFTGKLQYRANDVAAVTNTFGAWRRGEVKEVRNATAASGLVANGDFAHVAADTPVGVPDEVASDNPAAANATIAAAGSLPLPDAGNTTAPGTGATATKASDQPKTTAPNEGK